MTTLPTVKELLATRSSLLELKLQIVSFQIRRILQKYSPNQPRVPTGNPTGGQWTSGQSEESTKVAGKYDLGRLDICEAQLALDEELCRMVGSARCWSSSITRFAACMKSNYVPDLRL